MPVSAATGNGLYGVTGMTGIKNGSEGAASALTDIPHNLFMYPRCSVGDVLHICIFCVCENVMSMIVVFHAKTATTR